MVGPADRVAGCWGETAVSGLTMDCAGGGWAGRETTGVRFSGFGAVGLAVVGAGEAGGIGVAGGSGSSGVGRGMARRT